MKIKNAYIVHIDFDGDIAESKYCWGEWFVFTELEEAKAVIAEALTDLMKHEKDMGREPTICIGYRDVPIPKLLASERLFNDYIEYGGSDMGNWEISIRKTEAQ